MHLIYLPIGRYFFGQDSRHGCGVRLKLGTSRFNSYSWHHAQVAELADALVLGTSVFGREGSTPSLSTLSYMTKDVTPPVKRMPVGLARFDTWRQDMFCNITRFAL